ncbi:unnamed protein product [Schistosoma curassoni]|uniref:Uncharacterized protein n=1 Tax=Schistosoma curassoni TaxID=6186 RepID=A0A183JNE6_9TREM|nr:unnamed protein product [Schistosoma curassoni]
MVVELQINRRSLESLQLVQYCQDHKFLLLMLQLNEQPGTYTQSDIKRKNYYFINLVGQLQT